jgi:hypothetical protein
MNSHTPFVDERKSFDGYNDLFIQTRKSMGTNAFSPRLSSSLRRSVLMHTSDPQVE